MRDVLAVDPLLCRNCGTCVEECVGRTRAPDANHVNPTDPRCERCLHCYAVCPSGAITLADTYATLREPEAWHEIRPEALESFLAYRRSTRRFERRAVPRDVVERIVAAGRHVPSGGNRHSHEVTVLTDGSVRHALLARFLSYYGRLRLLIGNPIVKIIGSVALSPTERAFLADPKYGQVMKDLIDRFRAGEDPVFYNAPMVLIVHTPELIPTPQEDAVLSSFAMILMAQTLGLGTCLVSLAQKGLSANKECKALVGIAPDDYIHAVIVMGYPDVTYRRPTPKPAKQITWK